MTVLSARAHLLDPFLDRLNLPGIVAHLRAAPPATLALYAALSSTSLVLASLVRLILRNLRLRRSLLAQGIPAVPFTSPLHYLIGHIGILTAAEGPVNVMARNTREFGSVYMTAGLLGRPTLWVTDHVAMKTMMVTRTKKWHRTDEGRAMLAAVTGWKGLLAIEDEEHRIHRKIINPVFNLKHLKNLLPYISSSVDELVTLLSANPSATVDFVHYAQAATLNVIGRTAIAVDFDALNSQRKSRVHAAYEALAADFDTDPLANLRRVIPALAKLPVQSNRRFEHNMGVVRNEVRKIMAEFARAAQAGAGSGKVVEGESLIKRLYEEMRASEAADGDLGMTPDGVEHELLSFIAAGHDTTSITLTMALYEMGRHHEVRERLYRDLIAAVPRGSEVGADAYDRLVAEVPLLTHVINETLRVHCPVFINGRQATEDGELPLADGRVVRVSMGQRVFMPVQAIQVSPDLWGSTAAEWDPLRWESITTYEKDLADSMPADSTTATAATAVDRSNKKVLPPLAFMPFAFGKHSCVGREFAVLELRVFLYKFVTEFTWVSVTKGLVEKRYSITASPKEVKMRFSPRA